jgi:hypothetical protein
VGFPVAGGDEMAELAIVLDAEPGVQVVNVAVDRYFMSFRVFVRNRSITPDVLAAFAVAAKEDGPSARGYIGAHLARRRIDLGPEISGGSPAAVGFFKTDKNIIRAKPAAAPGIEEQVTLIRGDEGVGVKLGRVDGRSQVLGRGVALRRFFLRNRCRNFPGRRPGWS